MFKLTDIQGFSYYHPKNDKNEDLAAMVNLVAQATRQPGGAGWIKVYNDTMLRDELAIRADQIYTVQEVKKND